MHSSQWRLQDAKTQFSQVVEAALQGEPQHDRGCGGLPVGRANAAFAGEFFNFQRTHAA